MTNLLHDFKILFKPGEMKTHIKHTYSTYIADEETQVTHLSTVWRLPGESPLLSESWTIKKTKSRWPNCLRLIGKMLLVLAEFGYIVRWFLYWPSCWKLMIQCPCPSLLSPLASFVTVREIWTNMRLLIDSQFWSVTICVWECIFFVYILFCCLFLFLYVLYINGHKYKCTEDVSSLHK